MPSYVERDGDWVWRAPGSLEQVQMTIHVLRCQSAAGIQRLCDDFVNTPSAGAVQATPLFPAIPFVLLVCADIQKGMSTDPVDGQKGYMTERDVGFFVPTRFTDQAGVTSIAMLLPYLFVDNLPALLIGREIFGFPKILGDIEILADPPFAEVRSTTLETFSPDRCALPRPVVQVRTTGPGGINLCAPGSIATVTATVVAAILAALGIPAGGIPLGGFTQVPMLFLKQFRDAQAANQACYSAVVRAAASIAQLHQACFLTHPMAVEIPPYDSLNLETGLDLGTGPHVPVMSVRADLDFTLPLGTNEWVA